MRRPNPITTVALLAASGVLISWALACAQPVGSTNATVVADRYFDCIRIKDFDCAMSLYGAEFFEETGHDQLRQMLKRVAMRLGSPQAVELKNVITRRELGRHKNQLSITLVYRVHYPQADSNERITVLDPEDGSAPRIVGHRIDSDALRES